MDCRRANGSPPHIRRRIKGLLSGWLEYCVAISFRCGIAIPRFRPPSRQRRSEQETSSRRGLTRDPRKAPRNWKFRILARRAGFLQFNVVLDKHHGLAKANEAYVCIPRASNAHWTNFSSGGPAKASKRGLWSEQVPTLMAEARGWATASVAVLRSLLASDAALRSTVNGRRLDFGRPPPLTASCPVTGEDDPRYTVGGFVQACDVLRASHAAVAAPETLLWYAYACTVELCNTKLKGTYMTLTEADSRGKTFLNCQFKELGASSSRVAPYREVYRERNALMETPIEYLQRAAEDDAKRRSDQ